MSDPTITVRGYGTARVKPDGARFHLVVRRVAETPEAALEEATERSRGLEGLLGGLGIDPSEWTTTLVAMNEERRWDERTQQEVRTGFAATAGMDVLMKDLSQAGGLMAAAVARAEAQIAGPWWHVAPDNPALEEACGRAIEDAVRKAGALASALGARVGAVLSVTEPARFGDLPWAQPQGEYMRMAAGRGDEEMTLRAGGLEVGVSVDVSFELGGQEGS